MGTFLTALVALAVPYVVGVLTKWLMNLAKYVAAVDNAPNGGKRVIVVLISTALTAIFAWAGVHLTGSPFDATSEQVNTLAGALLTGLSSLLSAVYAMAAHAGDKASPDEAPKNSLR